MTAKITVFFVDNFANNSLLPSIIASNTIILSHQKFNPDLIRCSLIIAGLGSIILNQFGYQFSLLAWIDSWGITVGWAIRIGAIVGGAVLWVLGKNAAKNVDKTVTE